MPELNKKVFHEEVFQKCIDSIALIDGKTKQLLVLSKMIFDAKNLIGDSEQRFIKSYAEKDKIETVLIVVMLIKRLMDFFSLNKSSDYFHVTFEYVYKISDFYDLESYDYISSSYYRFNERFGLYAAPEGKILRKITYRNSFYIFYKIIWAIIQDINNQQEAWQFIGNYYYKKYVQAIDKEEGRIVFTNELLSNTPITFLSYAFKDRAYSLYLFIYFLDNGGFLFVDAIFGKKRNDGISIKDFLNPWIKASTQLLFLRSVTSDNRGVRQWCAWEIGRSYDGNHSFFIADIIGVKKTRNLLLDGFLQFNYVVDGIIY